ncbi:MAG: phosphotransferase [Demequinaceae bacterium]|nr:phosphotransferase [Demequinaceae bacterium]
MTLAQTQTAPEVHVDAALVTSLIATQVPEAGGFALGERFEGKDAIVWRLGDAWAVRLPKRQSAADRHGTEVDWLPRIGAAWPFKAPIPVRVGNATEAFPWRWTVVPWVPGEPSTAAPLSPVGAAQLGVALAALHATAPSQAPRHPKKSQPLLVRSARFEDRIDTLARRTDGTAWHLNVKAARRVFERGASVPRSAITWAHLDLKGQHVLTHHGYLAGIIDWGDAAAGDPAADIGQCLVLLPPSHWDAFVEGLGGIDMPTFARARAEAIDYAAMLALSPAKADVAAGWLGLRALGVARHHG